MRIRDIRDDPVHECFMAPDAVTSSEPMPSGENNPTTGPYIFTAVTDQLGLRLESRKGPVQVYVVEKIERPTEN